MSIITTKTKLSGKYKFFGKFLISISYLRFAKENIEKNKVK